jgi:hypothetical protein
MESARDKRVVVGLFPVLCAEGEEFIKAHVRFDDGLVFHHVLDSTVYAGDKFIIGGREITRQDGSELWIVRLGAKENPRDRLSHGNTSVLGEEMKAGSTAITASTPNSMYAEKNAGYSGNVTHQIGLQPSWNMRKLLI